MLPELKTQVLSIFAEADRAVTMFRQHTGLSCPPGCAACCRSERVEATVVELLPLAFHLFQTHQAELMLKRLDRTHNSPCCILFRPDLAESNGGGCSHYPFRALVCRLFGFAGTHDRTGAPRFARCRVMPAPAIPAQAHLSTPRSVMPIFHEFGMVVTTLHPDLGTTRRPINDAIREALLKVGLFLTYNEPVAAERDDNGLPPEKPLGSPLKPRRAA